MVSMHIASLPLAFLQAPAGMTDSQVHWLITFTALSAIAVLIEAIALGAIAVVVVKLIGQITVLTAELKPKIYPLMDQAKSISVKVNEITGKVNDMTTHVRDVVADTTPKVKRVTTNIAETSDVYRAKLAEIDDLVTDTANKAKRQTERVDNFVSSTISTAGKVAGRVEDVVLTPVHQASALWSAIKATTESLVSSYSKPTAKKPQVPEPVAFEGDNIYTGLEDDYHA